MTRATAAWGSGSEAVAKFEPYVGTASLVVAALLLTGCVMTHAECHRIPTGEWHCSGTGKPQE